MSEGIKDASWVLLPEGYQPDSKDSREECGMKYIKFYSETAYMKERKTVASLISLLANHQDHHEDCLDQDEEFGENETCECGAIEVQRAIAKERNR